MHSRLTERAVDLYYELILLNNTHDEIIVQLSAKDFKAVADELYKVSGGRTDYREASQGRFMGQVTLLKGK